MLTEAEVLAKLGNWLSPGDISEVIRKLLRVPEAWDQLHDPEFLDAVLNEKAEETLLPANMIKQVKLDVQDEGDLPEEPFEDLLENLKKEGELRFNAGRDLKDLAYLTTALLKVITSPVHPELLNELADNFERWLSPLACAWPCLEKGNELLQSLILQDWDQSSILVLNTVLANCSLEQSAPILLDITRSAPRYKVFLTLISREPALLDTIAQYIENLKPSTSPQESADLQLSLAILANFHGYTQLATESLDRAEELETEFTASLQDQKASIAQSLSMPEAESEARQQAIAIQDSSERRANFALTLLQQGKHAEAMEILPSEPQALPERIAVITALLEAGETDRVKSHLQSAVQETLLNPYEDPVWINRLIDVLRQEGDLPSAIKIASLRVEIAQGDAEALTRLAELLNQSGDPLKASKVATLAFALVPQSTQIRQILATSLQESGNPLEALAHWQTLAEENPLAFSHVAQCALEAGFYDLAMDVAQLILDQEPQSALGKILMGKALAAKGEIDEALNILEKATQEFPDQPDVWIALAECQDQTEDKESAGRTLATAIQLIPNNAQLLFAYADWLENQGRHTEAVEFAERATEADPKCFQYQLSYGGLLKDLGRFDEALPILEDAVGQKPFLWEAMVPLAQTYEALGDPVLASQTMKNMGAVAPSEAHLHAARMAVNAAQLQDDQDFLQTAKDHLDQAQVKGSTDPRVRFLQGQIEEMEGNHQAALESYEISAKNFIQSDPELYLETKLGIARTALAGNQLQLAASSLEEARFRYPNSIDVLLTLSQTYLQSGDELEALKTIERALKIEPANRHALKQIARIASQLNTWAPAMHALKKFVELTPEDPDAWVDYAENSLIVGNVPESRKALSSALRLDRTDPQILTASAKILNQMNEYRLAKHLLKRAIDHHSDAPHLLKQLAAAAEEAGDFETALNAWDRVLRSDPEDKQSLIKTAQAYWAVDEQSSAMELWHRLLKLDPSDISILEVLANAYIAQGDMQAGLNLFYKAINQYPENVDIALKAAQLALEFGAIKEAFDILTDVIRYAPKRTDVLLTTADCLVYRNMPDKALEVLDTIIDKEEFSARWFAIAAIASAMIGDINRAHSSLDHGLKHPELDGHSRLMLSQTALRLNRWSDAMEVLSDQAQDEPDLERILMEAHIRIRAMEVCQLYSDAEVISHGPPASLTDTKTLNRIQELLQSASTLPIKKAKVDQLVYRMKLLTHPENLDSLLQDQSHMEADSSGETLEAMALAKLRENLPSDTLNIIALRDDFNLEGELFDIITGLCQKKLNRSKLACEAFRDSQEKPLYQPMGQYLEAIVLQEEGEIENAKRLLNSTLVTWSDEPAWHYRLGQLYLQESNLDSALPHLQEATELAPTNELYNLSLARTLRDTGHLSHSFARFNLAVKNSPSDAQIWYEAGSIALVNAKAELAEKYFDRACSLSPSDVSCLVGAARASLALGSSKVALEKVRKALEITPDDPEALVAAGDIFSHQGKFDKAISSYELALSKASDPIPVQLARVRLLIHAGRVPAAIEQTSKLIEEYPDHENIWATHAEACEAADELKQAQEACAKAVRLAPNNPQFRLMLGRLTRKSGQLDRALDELSRLEQSDPTNSHVLIELGQLYEDRRQLNAALETYQRAISIDPESANAYFRAGLVLKHLKSYADAAAMLSKAVELEPNNPDSHHQLAAVRALELVHGGITQMAVSI